MENHDSGFKRVVKFLYVSVAFVLSYVFNVFSCFMEIFHANHCESAKISSAAKNRGFFYMEKQNWGYLFTRLRKHKKRVV